jgi:triacylglycerol lipase
VISKEANDGLVGRCSGHFGKVVRDDYPHNHGDAINQLFGIRGLFTPAPTDLYRQQANRLKVAGL